MSVKQASQANDERSVIGYDDVGKAVGKICSTVLFWASRVPSIRVLSYTITDISMGT